MAKTYRGILIFVVILGIVMGLAGKKFDGYVYTNTEPRSNTECTLTQRVFDDADVLTDEEEAKLEKLKMCIRDRYFYFGEDLHRIKSRCSRIQSI